MRKPKVPSSSPEKPEEFKYEKHFSHGEVSDIPPGRGAAYVLSRQRGQPGTSGEGPATKVAAKQTSSTHKNSKTASRTTGGKMGNIGRLLYSRSR